MRHRTDRVIEVANGTMLGIAEFGDLTGRPIFAFHGSPSCRLNLTFVDDAARRHAVTVIAADRWGIGLSPMADRARLVTWAEDVGAVADELGIARFCVLGLSGGGPYALACAARLPDRIDAAAVVSGPGPMAVPELRAVMAERTGCGPRSRCVRRSFSGRCSGGSAPMPATGLRRSRGWSRRVCRCRIAMRSREPRRTGPRTRP